MSATQSSAAASLHWYLKETTQAILATIDVAAAAAEQRDVPTSSSNDLFALPRLEAALQIDSHATWDGAIAADGSIHGRQPRPRPEDMYTALRETQNRSWAQETVYQGIKLAKEGQFDKAIGHYKKALEIDAKCSDAFVARGAAHANMGKLENAVHDFETALKIDPGHKNAQKYLDATRSKLESSTSPTVASPQPPASSQNAPLSSLVSSLSSKAIEKLKEEAKSWGEDGSSKKHKSKSKKDRKKHKKSASSKEAKKKSSKHRHKHHSNPSSPTLAANSTSSSSEGE